MGRKEVRSEPNCFPSSHLCAPERGFRPRTPAAATKLCPFKGSVDSRRGGEDAGSGRLGGAGAIAEEPPLPAAAAAAAVPLPKRPQPAPASQGDV